MKYAAAAIVVGIIFAVSAITLSEPAEELPIQGDDEIPAILVNAAEEPGLKLTVRALGPLKVGKECLFRVEIENTGGRVEVVYMPGLTVNGDFKRAPQQAQDGPVIRIVEDPPMSFGRIKAKDERLNYVVLMSDELYGRTFAWTPPALGEATFDAVYRNTKNGEEIGILAWTGRLEAGSDAMKINE